MATPRPELNRMSETIFVLNEFFRAWKVVKKNKFRRP